VSDLEGLATSLFEAGQDVFGENYASIGSGGRLVAAAENERRAGEDYADGAFDSTGRLELVCETGAFRAAFPAALESYHQETVNWRGKNWRLVETAEGEAFITLTLTDENQGS
tara:strand:+ start:3957 stop:4295 length:339 start_codon:yes stop_codon:yes gene_type:complete